MRRSSGPPEEEIDLTTLRSGARRRVGGRDERDRARGLVRSLAAGAVVFLLGAGVLVISRIQEGDSGSPAILESIGPAPHTEIGLYARQRHDDLAKRSGRVVAVVSFTAYVPDKEAPSLAGGRALAYLVAVPRQASEIVDDVGAWRASYHEQAVADRDGAAASLKAALNARSRQEAQASLDGWNAAIAALDAGEPVVYGVLVEGEAAQLRALVGKPTTRVVDVVDDAAADRRVVRGVRPEEARAGEPATRP